jgi:hypothetical protein
MDDWNTVGMADGSVQVPYLEKTCPTATLPNIDPTWTGLGLDLVLYSKRPAIKCLSYKLILFMV